MSYVLSLLLLRKYHIHSTGDVDIYNFHGDFCSSSLQLNFCFEIFFFSFSDSIPLLLIPPPGMAHTAKSLCLLSVYALQIFVDIYHFPPA